MAKPGRLRNHKNSHIVSTVEFQIVFQLQTDNLTLCMLGNFSSFLSSDFFSIFFFYFFFLKISFRNTNRVSNGLDPDNRLKLNLICHHLNMSIDELRAVKVAKDLSIRLTGYESHWFRS